MFERDKANLEHFEQILQMMESGPQHVEAYRVLTAPLIEKVRSDLTHWDSRGNDERKRTLEFMRIALEMVLAWHHRRPLVDHSEQELQHSAMIVADAAQGHRAIG